MEYKQHENLVFIKLDEGENLIESLKKVCREIKTTTTVILSGVGQLQKVTLGYYKEKNNYTPKKYIEKLELLSLTGTIFHSKDEYLPHLHIILGREDKTTIGGHLLEGIIGVTAEIIILVNPIEITRRYNPDTGLQEMMIR